MKTIITAISKIYLGKPSVFFPMGKGYLKTKDLMWKQLTQF